MFKSNLVRNINPYYSRTDCVIKARQYSVILYTTRKAENPQSLCHLVQQGQDPTSCVSLGNECMLSHATQENTGLTLDPEQIYIDYTLPRQGKVP